MADIYSTIPNEIKPTTTLDDRKKVVAYMKNNIGKYETAKNISANVGFKYKDNSVHLRKVITELIYFNHNLGPVDLSMPLLYLHGLQDHLFWDPVSN